MTHSDQARGIASTARKALAIIQDLRSRVESPVRESLDEVEDALTIVAGHLSADGPSPGWRMAWSFGLTTTEAEIFDILWRRGTSGASREQLWEALYADDRSGGPDVKIIDVYIHNIRRKMRVCCVPYFIETLWGRGYRIVSDEDGSRTDAFFRASNGGRQADGAASARITRYRASANRGA